MGLQVMKGNIQSTIDPNDRYFTTNSQLADTNIRSYFPNQVGGTETSLGVGLYKDSAQN